MNGRKYRIALYSPGMVGFGHIRRNASIAQALRRSALEPVIVMIAEARQAGALPMPEGVDSVTLPALCKEAEGWVKPRFLDVSEEEVIGLRTRVIRSAIKAFEPDVLIVDHLPLGAAGELARTLEHLRRHHTTRCVLGQRDVLQDAKTVNRRWREQASTNAVRDYYDAVWIYGDPVVYDSVQEYGLLDHVSEKVRYTGYLDQRPRLEFAAAQGAQLVTALPQGRLALCTVGGGQDGGALAEAFLQAELPEGMTGVLVTGPYMAEETRRRLQRLGARRPQIKVLEFVPESAPLIARADRVIAMGGYNTMCEVLSFEKHALIVPRVKPKPEQWIRAQRMSELGVVDLLHPRDLSAAALSRWLARDLGPPPRSRSRIDFGGLTRIPQLLAELLEEPAGAAQEGLAVAVG